MSWTADSEWLVSSFGETWRFWVVPICEQNAERGPSRAELVGQACPISHLLYSGFDSSGAVDDDVAVVLLRIYDVLTLGDVLDSLDNPNRPTEDPRGVLRSFERELAEAIYDAVELGRLRFERVVPPPWPFLDKE